MHFTVPNLKKLAELQEILDKRYREIHEIDYDTSNLKIIAFKVEFGEFLNENRFFKYWSKDKKPRTTLETDCPDCSNYDVHMCCTCQGTGLYTFGPENPQLEEYVDGIHFILSIGIERKYIKWMHSLEAAYIIPKSMETLALDIYSNPINSAGKWFECLVDYLHIGDLVGIHAKDIEEAYLKKNAMNHARQDQGY